MSHYHVKGSLSFYIGREKFQAKDNPKFKDKRKKSFYYTQNKLVP